MIAFTPCKINIGLLIQEKRTDGYHNLKTFFYPLPFYDILEIIEAETFKFVTYGHPLDCADEDNICLKAYNLLKKDFNLPTIRIHLYKNIPSKMGLGGGSSNGTHTLLLLDTLFTLNLSEEHKAEYAGRLGADCPFFLHNSPMFGKGIGDILTQAPPSLKNHFVALCFPDNIRIDTAYLFSQIHPKKRSIDFHSIISNHAVEQWKEQGINNDFEPLVFQQYPLLERIKTELDMSGSLFSSMTGTGACVFGVFEKRPQNIDIKNVAIKILEIKE